MVLRTSNGAHSSITTVWDGQPIMVIWNNVINDIAFQVWGDDIVVEEDELKLREMVREFLIGLIN